MKQFLPLALLLLAQTAFTQRSKPYYKIAPALLFIEKSDPSPTLSLGFGSKLNDFMALGATLGYFKLDGRSKGVIPIGLDLTITDYEKRTLQPVFIVQTSYPIYEEKEEVSGSLYPGTTKGRFMVNTSVGVAVPLKNNQKFLLTGGYTQLFLKSRSEVSGTVKSKIGMIPLTLTIML